MLFARRPGCRSQARTAAWLSLLLAALSLAVHGRAATNREASARLQQASSAPRQVAEDEARATCGGCHTLPPPDILPRYMWRDEFVRMMFIRDGRLPPLGDPTTIYRTVKLPADMERVLPFYTERAPERLPAPDVWPEPEESPLRFTRRTLAVPDMPGTPAVSSVHLVHFDGDGTLDVLGTDMRQGVVFTAVSAATASGLSVVASIPHPARVGLGDVDGDGASDLLVSELGEFLPADHTKGAVIWMRRLESGKFAAFWLDGWPRVSDVQAADFTGDGKNDLAVAAFGWRTSGQLAILHNETTNPVLPKFTPHTLDKRTGAVETIPVDLNQDGRMDLVTLLAQEHETVLAYINKGAGELAFEQKVIYAAPHPNWGSSGIRLADLDGDKDTDVILTHGDTFDDGIVKPYHGIQWLENTGTYPFVPHSLANMPGVHRAEAGDLDGDGDLDLAACALLAAGSDVDERTLPALVWLEQTKRGTFVRHTIEKGFPRHAALSLGDIDGDGDVDMAVSNFSVEKRTGGWVDLWINERTKPPAEAPDRPRSPSSGRR